MVTMEREKKGSFGRNRLIKMEITRDRMRIISFLHKLETWETMLEIGFIFTQA